MTSRDFRVEKRQSSEKACGESSSFVVKVSDRSEGRRFKTLVRQADVAGPLSKILNPQLNKM